MDTDQWAEAVVAMGGKYQVLQLHSNSLLKQVLVRAYTGSFHLFTTTQVLNVKDESGFLLWPTQVRQARVELLVPFSIAQHFRELLVPFSIAQHFRELLVPFSIAQHFRCLRG